MEAEWVRGHLPRGPALIADLGCGIGGLFETIGLRRAIGVDLSVPGLSRTKNGFPSVPLLCADAERLPFGDSALDAITLQHVVEHIVAYERACREWLRTLKPGGVLLLMTPNAGFRDPAVFNDETHVRLFTHAELFRVLRHVGFEIIDMRSLGLPWFRNYGRFPGDWRLRRWVTEHARRLSALPHWRRKGQTLCCAARRPLS